MKNKITILFVISLMLLSACGQQPIVNDNQAGTGSGEGQSTYKIGVMLPLTGDAAAYGLPIQKAIQTAIDEVNSEEGIKIEPIYEDSKCNAKDGNSAAQKLVNINKVKAIIGGVCSGETLGAAPITEAAKVVLISPSATSPDITTAGDYVFRVAPSDAYAGIVASDYAYNGMNARNAAVISEATDYAQGLRKVFKEQFGQLGGKIVADEVYNPEDTDFRTQVTKIKAAKPDVIYLIPQTPQKGLLIIKQIKESGLSSKLLSAEVLMGRNNVKENGKDMEGLIGIEQKFDDKNPKTAKLLSKYKQETGEDAPFPGYMAGGYDIVYLLRDAIAKNGYNGEKIKAYLYAVDGYDGAVGKLKMDENGDVLMEYSILQVKNGVLVPAQATPHKTD